MNKLNIIKAFTFLTIILSILHNIEAGRCKCVVEQNPPFVKEERKKLPKGEFFSKEEENFKFVSEFHANSEEDCKDKCNKSKEKLSKTMGIPKNITVNSHFSA